VTAAAGDELVDIVDDDDNVIDVVTRRTMRAERLRHRAVYIVVVNREGRVLIHQRSFDKDIAAGWWDIAVGGVVGAGEHYDDAAVREVSEEIGVDAAGADDAVDTDDRGALPRLEPLGSARFEHDELRVVGRVYRLVHDGPFTFADGEVIVAEWVTIDALHRLLDLDERRFCTDSLAIVLPLLGGSRTLLS
jgi:8-oxo-dGTP pyrophosphatase MutT (NUDIX family)